MQAKLEANDQAGVMKAYDNVYKALGLNIEQAASLVGVGRSTLIRKNDGFEIHSKQAELQILFIRMYRSLFALFGGNQKAMLHWFDNGNKCIRGVPKDLCFTVTGLVNINAYLDGLRGKM
jgi:hypothetical protein